MVAEVLPRRSELSDPAIANVDQIVLVFAAADPPFDPPNVTRFLVTAEQVFHSCMLETRPLMLTSPHGHTVTVAEWSLRYVGAD